MLQDEQFLIKTFLELIKDEELRIVSAGLAQRKEVVGLFDPLIKDASSNPFVHYPSQVLSKIHQKLSTIQLPGDFEKLAEDEKEKEKFYDLSSLPELTPKSEKDKLQYVTPKSEEPDPEEVFEEEPAQEEGELSCDVGEFTIGESERLSSYIEDKLEKIAYSLGTRGEHEAAYLIERKMNEIRALAAQEDMWGEMDRMETQQQQRPQPQLTQQQVAQMTQQMSQQEWQQRSQQAAQQVNKQPRPQARREQQHQQQARQPGPQQSAPQQQQPVQQQKAQQPTQPNPRLQQLWQSLTPQQKVQYNQLRKQRPTMRPEHLMQMVKQQKS